MDSKSDVASVLSSARWSEEGSYLGEIAKSTNGLPCIVKVVRGQYQNVGQPSFSNPNLASHLLLLSAGKQQSIAAQCVKFKNQNQRVIPFGPTLAIPQSFEGHFEILSEDGKCIPCIQSVEGLIKRFPDSCLVREAIKGYKADTPSVTNINLLAHQSKNSKSSNNINNSDEVPKIPLPIVTPESTPYYRISDKNRIVHCGEVLHLVGQVTVPSSNGKKIATYLRCFDAKGSTVYLNTSQKGKFSPLARQDSISGVHTTKNLLNKRMPMMVRLVDGKPPVNSFNKNNSSFKKFVPELRLFSIIQEELIFGMPLSQSSKDIPLILPLPLSAPLKFQVCCNFAQVEQMKEFCRLHEKMKTLMDVAKNLIQIYDINLKRELRFDGRQWKAYSPPIFLNSTSPTTPENTPISPLAIQHFSSTSNGSVGGELISSNPNSCNNHNYEVPDVQDYEDIDQIYDYVRGVKPLPPPQVFHQHSTTTVIIGENVSKQKVRRTAGGERGNNSGHGGAVEKKISTKHQIAVRQFHKSSYQNGTKSSSSTFVANSVNETKVSHIAGGPIKPPRRPLMRKALSVDRLIDINNGDDEKPEPPPIETIPTHKNKLLAQKHQQQTQTQEQHLQKNSFITDDTYDKFLDVHEEDEEDETDDSDKFDTGVKVTSTNNYYEVTSKQTTTEKHNIKNCHQHNPPVAINPLNCHNQKNNKSAKDNYYQEINHHDSSSVEDLKKKMAQRQKNTTKVLISSSNESSPNNTTSTTSGVSTSSGCAIIITTSNAPAGHCNNNDHNVDNNKINNSANNINLDNEKVKVKKHHYVKRNSQSSNSNKNETSKINSNPLASRPLPSISTTPNASSGVISGSPTNRLLFRRSPIFDCRYKSMNDLNRSSLESGVSISSSGGGGGGLGNKLSRYFQSPQHQHQTSSSPKRQQHYQASHKLKTAKHAPNRNSEHYHSNSNINVNLFNFNIKASAKHKALFRPKSLTNLLDITTPFSSRAGGGGNLGFGGGGKSSCRKKLLDNMVVGHQSSNTNKRHSIHSSVPSFDIFQKFSNSTASNSSVSKRNSYSSSGGGSRKTSQLQTLYL